MPKLGASDRIAAVTPAQGETRKRVGLLLGCVQREFMPEINAATVRPDSCSRRLRSHRAPGPALLRSVDGARRRGSSRARSGPSSDRRIRADAKVDVIITNAGGCGSNVREYGYQLRDDPQYAESARQVDFLLNARDISEFLEELGPRAERKPLNMRDRLSRLVPSAARAQRVLRTQPRTLLSAIPGVEMQDLPEAALCCGSAGIYNLVQPETADALADRKAQHISTATRPNVVATGNIGCMLQIAAALERQGQKTPVMHTIQLIDASLRGIRPPGL